MGEIDLQRNEREPLVLHLSDDLAQLFLVDKKFPSPERINIAVAAVRIRTDVRCLQPELAVSDHRIAIGDVRLLLAQGLYFCPFEHDPGFVGLDDSVLVSGFTVGGYQRIARFLLDRHRVSKILCIV
jgi:hypothetical protein